MGSRSIEELQRIWALKEKGAISAQEYLQLKAQILSAESTQEFQRTSARPPISQTTRGAAPQNNATRKWIIGSVASIGVLFVIAAVTGTPSNENGNSGLANNESIMNSVTPPLSPKERQRQIKEILSDLKYVRANNYERRGELYSKLAGLDPENPGYAAKRDEYANKRQEAEAYKTDPGTALSITNFHGSKEAFGTVLIVSFTVKNAAPFDIKDFEVTCEHSAPSGTRIDSNVRTIYEVVPANGSKSIRNFNMGFIASQATSTYCHVTSAKADVYS